MSIDHEAGRTGEIAWDLYDSGDGVPLVALHGWSDAGGCWSPLVSTWAPGRSMLTIDARGHGRSRLPDEPFTIEALAADVAAVIRVVLGRPAVVIGHSMGGLVAEELALAHPELVVALVLEDPAWRVARDVDGLGVPTMLRDGVRAMTGLSHAELVAGARRESPAWPTDELEPWADAKVALDPRVVQVRHVWDGRDWVESLADLTCPVTLLTGQVSLGAIVDAEQVARAALLLGHRLHHVPLPTGHNVRREARPAVAAVVGEVLAAADAEDRGREI
ncbi:MAG TPA: alpha/beta hydrolase [Actinotalea sp.]|nr:alpha/beta hydrolase [Actinotalea sp.]